MTRPTSAAGRAGAAADEHQHHDHRLQPRGPQRIILRTEAGRADRGHDDEKAMAQRLGAVDPPRAYDDQAGA